MITMDEAVKQTWQQSKGSDRQKALWSLLLKVLKANESLQDEVKGLDDDEKEILQGYYENDMQYLKRDLGNFLVSVGEHYFDEAEEPNLTEKK